mgnify:CR=1 FL=1
MSEAFWWKKASFSYFAARKTKFVQDMYAAFLDKIDNLDLPEGAMVLDAGCGDGNAALALAERGFDVVGLDYGEHILGQARKRQQRLNIKNVAFEFGDLNNPLKYDSDSFDLVVSVHTMMKVKEFKKSFKEFYRILKPGGRAVITSTTSRERFSSWMKRYIAQNGLIKALWDVRWLMVWTLPYVIVTKKSERHNEWRWTRDELSALMNEAGFKTIETQDVPYFHVGCAIGVFQKQPGGGD